MRWRKRAGVRWLEAELPGARAAFSTRLGGVSDGPFASLNLGWLTGDKRVPENRRRLTAALGLDARDVLIGRQVHAAEVVRHEARMDRRPRGRPTARRPPARASRRSSSLPTVSRWRSPARGAWR